MEPQPGVQCGAKVCDKVTFGVDRTVFRCLVPKIQALKAFLLESSRIFSLVQEFASTLCVQSWDFSFKKLIFKDEMIFAEKCQKIHPRQEWSNLHSNFTEKRLFWHKEPPRVTVPFFKGARLGKPWLMTRFFWSAHTQPKSHKKIRQKQTYEPIELKFAEPQGGAPWCVCLKGEQKFPMGKINFLKIENFETKLGRSYRACPLVPKNPHLSWFGSEMLA